MQIAKCPVVGPQGWCQHDDGDGYWPAVALQTRCSEDEAIALGEHTMPLLSLPAGWEWASETVFVHVGPMTSFDGLRETVISRAIRQAA